MHVEKLTVTNYRNYVHASAGLGPGRNILIGENAQGKTNFLEALELLSTGRSPRANQDSDLIRAGAKEMSIEVLLKVDGRNETIAMTMCLAGGSSVVRANGQTKSVEKHFKLNGISHSSIKSIKGRLVTVSFNSQDLNLLRGGPKFRRTWLDVILSTLRPVYEDVLNKYMKVVAQRNRLLKQLSERGKVSVVDNDQLKAWDTQLAKFGAFVIKQRVALICELLPEAEKFQEYMSGARETLAAEYLFKSNQVNDSLLDDSELEPAHHDFTDQDSVTRAKHKMNTEELNAASEEDVAQLLTSLLKGLRYEEIRRKQTLLGPHRDDIQFFLNGANAVYFASQGQQRSLVLSLKLAELARVTGHLQEPPVLLLDDVLAELDLERQRLLMSLVAKETQTIITTTHVSGFKPEWLEGARFLSVKGGALEVSPAPSEQAALHLEY